MPGRSVRGGSRRDRSTQRRILRPPIVPTGARYRELHWSGTAAYHSTERLPPGIANGGCGAWAGIAVNNAEGLQSVGDLPSKPVSGRTAGNYKASRANAARIPA